MNLQNKDERELFYLSELSRLPIKYYYGAVAYKVILDNKEKGTFIDKIKREIHISKPMLEQHRESERDTRGLLYHEVSHAILTPNNFKLDGALALKEVSKDIVLNADVVNIFEDERIETLLKGYYMDTDFEYNKRKVCFGKYYKSKLYDTISMDKFSAFFLRAIRMRKDKDNLSFATELATKKGDVKLRDDILELQEKIDNFYKKEINNTFLISTGYFNGIHGDFVPLNNGFYNSNFFNSMKTIYSDAYKVYERCRAIKKELLKEQLKDNPLKMKAPSNQPQDSGDNDGDDSSGNSSETISSTPDDKENSLIDEVQNELNEEKEKEQPKEKSKSKSSEKNTDEQDLDNDSDSGEEGSGDTEDIDNDDLDNESSGDTTDTTDTNDSETNEDSENEKDSEGSAKLDDTSKDNADNENTSDNDSEGDELDKDSDSDLSNDSESENSENELDNDNENENSGDETTNGSDGELDNDEIDGDIDEEEKSLDERIKDTLNENNENEKNDEKNILDEKAEEQVPNINHIKGDNKDFVAKRQGLIDSLIKGGVIDEKDISKEITKFNPYKNLIDLFVPSGVKGKYVGHNNIGSGSFNVNRYNPNPSKPQDLMWWDTKTHFGVEKGLGDKKHINIVIDSSGSYSGNVEATYKILKQFDDAFKTRKDIITYDFYICACGIKKIKSPLEYLYANGKMLDATGEVVNMRNEEDAKLYIKYGASWGNGLTDYDLPILNKLEKEATKKNMYNIILFDGSLCRNECDYGNGIKATNPSRKNEYELASKMLKNAYGVLDSDFVYYYKSFLPDTFEKDKKNYLVVRNSSDYPNILNKTIYGIVEDIFITRNSLSKNILNLKRKHKKELVIEV